MWLDKGGTIMIKPFLQDICGLLATLLLIAGAVMLAAGIASNPNFPV